MMRMMVLLLVMLLMFLTGSPVSNKCRVIGRSRKISAPIFRFWNITDDIITTNLMVQMIRRSFRLCHIIKGSITAGKAMRRGLKGTVTVVIVDINIMIIFFCHDNSSPLKLLIFIHYKVLIIVVNIIHR